MQGVMEVKLSNNLIFWALRPGLEGSYKALL